MVSSGEALISTLRCTIAIANLLSVAALRGGPKRPCSPDAGGGTRTPDMRIMTGSTEVGFGLGGEPAWGRLPDADGVTAARCARMISAVARGDVAAAQGPTL